MVTFEELRASIGLEEARVRVIEWLRTMADDIESDSDSDVMVAELTESEFAGMVSLNITTSYPWPG